MPLHFRSRLCACAMAHGAGGYERLVAPIKRELFAQLPAGAGVEVVEVGPGAGANLPYLPHGIRYTAVEPNRFMHRHLHRRAAAAGMADSLRLIPEPLETALLHDASADAVVCTLVLCSVPDPAAALARIRRLLRPGGLLLFIEHVAAPRGTLRRRVQRSVRPAWRWLGDGCEPDRETWGAIESAGFAQVSLTHGRVRVPVISPHVWGTARV